MDKFVTAIRRYFLDLNDSNLKETPRREKFLVLLNDLNSVIVDSGSIQGTLARRRSLAREAAALELEEINTAVKRMLDA
jgi:hypothetical protein